MRRLRLMRSRRPVPVCFCDGCGRVERCDTAARLDRARQRDMFRHGLLPLR